VEKCGKLFWVAADVFEGIARAGAMGMVRPEDSLSLRACSACAGDYEDPERTAGEQFEEMLAGDDARDLGAEVRDRE
jgi:hypothetical protein